MGEEGLRDGLRDYLQRYAFANASWPDLIAILDARTGRDLAAWSETWVTTPGRPEFFIGTGEHGEQQLRQVDPAGTGRVWPQRFDLLQLYPASRDTATLMA